MQIAACQPVSFCLEYNLRQDEHAVTGNAGAPSIPGSPFRVAGYSTAAQVNVEWRQRRIWPQFYPDDRATVLSFLPRYRQLATAAVVTIIEVGNALKADIERSGLKYREVPISDIAPPIRSTRRH